MAKTLSEELLGLLDADTQAKVKAAFAANPSLMVRDVKGTELYDLYTGFEPEPTTTTTTTTHTPTLPSSATTTSAAQVPNTTTNAPGNAEGYAAILAKLDGIQTGIDAKIAAATKDMIPVAKLPEYRTEILTAAIKSADDYASVRESHRDEFKEPLDRNAFETFVATQNQAGVKFPSLRAAHDTFVSEKRTTAAATREQAKIDAAVAEALKQARSSASVPGQTQMTGLSPVAQIQAKARAAATNNGESNAMKAARLLEAQDRMRQDTVQ